MREEASAKSARRLVLSRRARWFTRDGSDYLHTSAVPLAYLSASPHLRALLQSCSTPRLSGELFPSPTAADTGFLVALVRAGILTDAVAPDPVHALRPPDPAARTLLLFPSNACNLRCVYCYAAAGPAGPQLRTADANLAIDDLFTRLPPGSRTVHLAFHGGGEPTLNFPVMREALAYCRSIASSRGLTVRARTISNGLFGHDVLRELQGPDWQVLISYDGCRQAVQRPAADGSDSRAHVVAAIRALRAAGKPVPVRTTLTRAGLPSLRALICEAAELGVQALQVEPASGSGRGAVLADGPPDAAEFAAAFLADFRFALQHRVRLTTAAWSHLRVGDGRYCAAQRGLRALTPDGRLVACTEAGGAADSPLLVGRLDVARQCFTVDAAREQALQARTADTLDGCQDCFMADTCAGGCVARALTQSGSIHERNPVHCTISRNINREMIADLAEGRLLPDDGWQPFVAELVPGASALPEVSGRLVALVPRFAQAHWNSDPERRPFCALPPDASRFLHLPG